MTDEQQIAALIKRISDLEYDRKKTVKYVRDLEYRIHLLENPVVAAQPLAERNIQIVGETGPEMVQMPNGEMKAASEPKPAYKIMAFRATEKHRLPGSISHIVEPWQINQYIDQPLFYEIYRVRRLSDGSNWELGQDITFDTGAKTHGKIEKFKVGDFAFDKGNMYAVFTDNEGDQCRKGCKNWRPYVPPAWEIVEFKGARETVYDRSLCRDGQYRHATDEAGIPLDEMLRGDVSVEDGAFSIHAVRRADGEVFRVGDVVNHGTIKSFHMFNNDILVHGTGFHLPLSDVSVKKPIFTTADGVDHYDESDIIWILFTSDGRIEQKAYRQIDPVDWGAGKPELYHTREAVDEAYKKWLYSQPVLTLWDISSHVPGPLSFDVMVALVESKIRKA